MGGDAAPRPVVDGALAAVRHFDLGVLLVGRTSLIDAELARHPDVDAGRVRVVDAGDVVEAAADGAGAVADRDGGGRLAHGAAQAVDPQRRQAGRDRAGERVEGGAAPPGPHQVRTDGGFTLNNVPPGEYTIDVQQRPRDLQNLRANAGALAGQLEFASIPLSVSGGASPLTPLMATRSLSCCVRVIVSNRVVTSGPR